jgi:DNA-binding NarL/FixJ family response regulator
MSSTSGSDDASHNMPIRLMIVDDHEMVREGLRLTFEGTDIEVVAEAADGQEAFDKLKQHAIDVALVDIRMPRADGFQLLEMLRNAGLKLPVVLMHSVQDGTQAIRRCQDLGAKGLIRKGEEKEQLLTAVHSVHSGRDLWDGQPS